MAVKERIPDTSVKLIDIRDTINAFGGSAGNDLTTFFQKNDMNMWAKYKFTIVPDRPFVDDDERWQGGDGTCGLDIPEFSSPSRIRSALTGGDADWTYKPPYGTTAAPMRLGDARDYTYQAVCPIGNMASTYILRSTTTGYEFDINVEVVVDSSDYNLTLDDISIRGVKLKNMYLGAYLVPESGSGYFFGGTSTTIGSKTSLDMTLKGSSGTAGKYSAYVFLSTTSQAGSEQSGYFYGLHKAAQTVTIQSASTLHVLSCYGIWSADGTSFYYEITITNNTSASVTYSGIKVYLGQGSDVSAPGNILSWNASTTAKTVAAGGTATITGTVNTSRSESVMYMCGAGCTTPYVYPVFGYMDEEPPEG